MRSLLFLCVVTLAAALVPGGGLAQPSRLQQPGASPAVPCTVQVTTATVTIPTYPYADFLCMGHSDVYNMDYPILDWQDYEASNPQPADKSYTAVVLDNNWLQLTFLPELGGRLYGVTVKATGEELLYQNPVVKPTQWGPPEQGWWLAAGGIEWCLPVEEHGYESALPWSYEISDALEGSTITLHDSTAMDRVRATISVFLPVDQAAFWITPRLDNPTDNAVSFRFWANAMLAPGAANTVGPDLNFVVPIQQVTVHSTGDDRLPGPQGAMTWPIYHDVDYSRLGNWNEWLGFFARPQALQDWAGVYDEGVLRGIVRVFPHQVATGVKGFAMGWNNPIDASNWTDPPYTYYIELHSGPSPTFWDSLTLEAGQSLEWSEVWMPLQGIPALTMATAEVALGVKAHGQDLQVAVQVAGQHSDLSVRVWLRSDCSLLAQYDGVSLDPGGTYAQTLIGADLSEEEAVLGVLENGQVLAASDLVGCPRHAIWVPLVSK
jgi:hypothetical protein